MRCAWNLKEKVRPKAAISGAIKAEGPEPAATMTLELSMMQREQTPSMKRKASARKHLASKRPKWG